VVSTLLLKKGDCERAKEKDEKFLLKTDEVGDGVD